MKDNARITVKGNQNASSEDELIEMQTTGKWFTKDNKDYIFYNDTELIESVETKTRVTIDGNTVSIIRKGATNTHLVFEKGITHMIPYETPFGILDMVSSTKDIQVSRKLDSIELTVMYSLEMNQQDMGPSSFYICAKRL
jgi:uncharacterized beta-barrel protein YwiB (DUF1934 family)